MKNVEVRPAFFGVDSTVFEASFVNPFLRTSKIASVLGIFHYRLRMKKAIHNSASEVPHIVRAANA